MSWPARRTGCFTGRLALAIRDRWQGTTVRVDPSPITLKAANGPGQEPVISDDGRYVAFESEATNLLAADSNGQADVYRWDRIAGTTERVSVTGVATESDGSSFSAAISADGQTVAFVSQASNFGGVPEPTFGLYQNVYVRDVAAQTTELVSVSGTGAPALGLSDRPLSTMALTAAATVMLGPGASVGTPTLPTCQ